MTEIENQLIDPHADSPADGGVAEGGDAGAQVVASENTGDATFTGTQDPMSLAAHADHGDLESLNTVEPVEVVETASSEIVNTFLERLLRLYAISYSWKQVEDTVNRRLAGEVPVGYEIKDLIDMAVNMQAHNEGLAPDYDTRGQEPGAHGDDSVEAEVAQAEADEAAVSARVMGETPTQSALSQKLGISDELLDEVLPCGHTRRDHHADLTEGGGPLGLLASLFREAGDPSKVRKVDIGEGFNLFEILGGMQPAVPTVGHGFQDDAPEREGSPLQQRLADNTPLIEAELSLTLPSGETWSTEISVDAGHAWGHSLHGDEQCLKALASLVEQLLVEMRAKFDREMLVASLEYDSQAKNTCVK